ncbi:tyrosine-type recombinase/integrase [Streptomyces sp. NPDC101455]|uniref:tyrosine-type recombinase/integrase n=1 Tax=Streptomyces sp. NPDC101455 TaxID=3366142 RepID=UPI00381A24E3
MPGWGEKLTPHVLRHFRASQLYGNGMDLLAIQEILGHSWIATTMRRRATSSPPTPATAVWPGATSADASVPPATCSAAVTRRPPASAAAESSL